jgi:hypothetical protein
MPRVVEPKTKTCNYDSTLAQGGWVQALCIGVDEYTHLSQLGNCVRDATAMAQKVRGKCSNVLHPSVRVLVMLVCVGVYICVPARARSVCMPCMHARTRTPHVHQRH